MPPYEMLFSVKRLPKDELTSLLKRVGEVVLDNYGILRKIEYLGTRTFARRLKKYEEPHTDPSHKAGSHFLYHCDLPPNLKLSLERQLKLERDVIRLTLWAKHDQLPADYTCTLPQELLPPSFRPSVQNLIKHGRKIPSQKPWNYGPDGLRWDRINNNGRMQ